MEKLFFERTLKAPRDKVWSVITEPAHLSQWYFDFSEQWKLEIGHTFEWEAGSPEGKQWLHKGMIVEIEPGSKLSHTWEYPGYIGRASVTWELFTQDIETTLLKLTFEFLIPFDESEEALRKEAFEEGWNHIVNQSLVEYLEKI